MTSKSLPSQFSDLDRFADWACASESERHRKRLRTPIAELKQCYDALLPRMQAILAFLDRAELGKIEDEEMANLYRLALAFMEISHPVELGWLSGSNAEGFPSTRIELPIRDR